MVHYYNFLKIEIHYIKPNMSAENDLPDLSDLPDLIPTAHHHINDSPESTDLQDPTALQCNIGQPEMPDYLQTLHCYYND